MKKPLNILSIDWDWFFPNSELFDWGHSEEQAMFLEMAWSWRCGNIRIGSDQLAVDVMNPDTTRLSGFWERTVKGKPWQISICESHKALYEWIAGGMCKNQKAAITNFDAHHDGGYSNAPSLKVNCGNWAEYLHRERKMFSYKVVYPPWRKEEPEGGFPEFGNAVYEPPDAERYDYIFICRSGAWVPTWCDDAWTKFIEYWKKDEWLWQDKMYQPFALKTRKPDLETAKTLAVDQRKMVEENFAKTRLP
jgi:hypothetical protein